MKKILLALLFVTSIAQAQTYCNQSAMVPTKTYTASGSVLCCTMEKILVCPGASTASMNYVADSVYSMMIHRIFLSSNTVMWLKNPNNSDTIFMKSLSILNIKGTLNGTITVVSEPNSLVNNMNSNCTVKTVTCASITSPTASCSGSSSIKENAIVLNGLKVYPNPANDRITIELESAFSAEQKLYIMNSLGQIVKEGKLNSNTTELSLKDLAAGIYYLSCENSAPIKLSITK